ncbi:hypothetical protein CALCODRAFT_501511 [Calocera cornea HHB12733]|uniref:Uncharacterized protein n=1 Tax=Calocera cornea HHB12733 TaxID=1353952 RepID=A0A165DLQ5_9BASI|nr:hypothetical protein CALCODRAFT_501511 [Calocera cornea HHB12733]
MRKSRHIAEVPPASTVENNPDRPDFGERWNATCPADESRLIDIIKSADLEIVSIQSVLNERQSQLRKKQDDLYALRARRAPITRVPDDVLSLIFESHAAVLEPRITSKGEQPPFQIICAQVSRRWRTVAYHTASLWSRFRIADRRSLEYATSLTMVHLSPFGITLDLKCSATRAKGPLFRELMGFVSCRSSRLKYLHSDMCHHANGHFFDRMAYSFPLLEAIRLTPGFCLWAEELDDLWDGRGIASAPMLRDVAIEGGILPMDFLVFPNISRLSLSEVYEGIWYEVVSLLADFPRLQNLRLNDITTLPEDDTIHSRISLRLDHLQTLTIQDCTPSFMRPPVMLHFSSLIALTLIRLDLNVLNPSMATLFLQQLNTVTTLTISGKDTVVLLLGALKASCHAGRPVLPRLTELSVHIQPACCHGCSTSASKQVVNGLNCRLLGFLLARRKLNCRLHALRVSMTVHNWYRRIFAGQVAIFECFPSTELYIPDR